MQETESYYLNHDELKKALVAYLVLYKKVDLKAGDKLQLVITGDDETDLTVQVKVFKPNEG